MADTLDVLTLAEARAALNIQSSDTSQDTELAGYITAVSRKLDDLCGAVVARTVTAEEHPGGTSALFLRQAPVSQAGGTTISEVVEYSGGTPTTLTAESLTVQGDSNYRFDATLGVLTRRSGWTDTPFASQAVTVTYSAGRYASTAAVDPLFKTAAAMLLKHLWTRNQGVAGSSVFGADDDAGVPQGFAVPKAVLELLSDELRPPAVA